MAAATALSSPMDVREFINEYFGAWRGTDENHIMSYYAPEVQLRIPGLELNGAAAVREQFVRPFIAGFPGNRHVAKNMIFGSSAVVVEWSFEAEHKGPFAGRSASGASVQVPGCSVYEFDAATRRITGGRIYFDLGTLLRQIGAA
jgi:predicted ester cyclase